MSNSIILHPLRFIPIIVDITKYAQRNNGISKTMDEITEVPLYIDSHTVVKQTVKPSCQ